MRLTETRERSALDLARVAVLLNANARDVGARARAEVEEALPEADVYTTHTPAEAERAAAEIVRRGHEVVLSGGGDGSAARLVNMLHALGVRQPRIGLLKLGTGNGWAHAVGTADGGLAAVLAGFRRAAAEGTLKSERFNVLEVEGGLAPFTGVGWDARILNDFADVWRGREGLSLRVRKSLAGYAVAILGSSWPKEARAYREHGRAQATVRLLSGEAFAIGPDGAQVPLELRRGDPIYRGPVTIAGCATMENFGFGLRAHPYARARRGFMSFRAVNISVAGALLRLPSLWRGTIRHDGFRDFLARHVRFELSRPLPFQISGDAMGERSEFEVRVSDAEVDILTWRVRP